MMSSEVVSWVIAGVGVEFEVVEIFGSGMIAGIDGVDMVVLRGYVKVIAERPWAAMDDKVEQARALSVALLVGVTSLYFLAGYWTSSRPSLNEREYVVTQSISREFDM